MFVCYQTKNTLENEYATWDVFCINFPVIFLFFFSFLRFSSLFCLSEAQGINEEKKEQRNGSRERSPDKHRQSGRNEKIFKSSVFGGRNRAIFIGLSFDWCEAGR